MYCHTITHFLWDERCFVSSEYSFKASWNVLQLTWDMPKKTSSSNWKVRVVNNFTLTILWYLFQFNLIQNKWSVCCRWQWGPCVLQVELATGQFPYKNCKTDFEVLTKVLQEDPPLLPLSMGFSLDFQSFVKDWWAQIALLNFTLVLFSGTCHDCLHLKSKQRTSLLCQMTDLMLLTRSVCEMWFVINHMSLVAVCLF